MSTGATGQAAAMTMYGERRRCTAVLQLDKGVVRSEILGMLEKDIDKRTVMAVGQLSNNSREVVFQDEQIKQQFATSVHEIGGRRVTIADLQRSTRRIRILHVPMCIPSEFLTDILRDSGVQVKHIGYAVDKVDGLMSNVYVWERLRVETRTASMIPFSGSLMGCPVMP